MSKADVLMSLLPPLYENVLEMQLLTETEGEELGKIAAELEGVLDQFYPESATWALERYERDLQIPTNPAKPEEQRRSVIISKMRGSGKVSGSMLKNVAQAYESGGIEVSVSPEEYLIRIRFIDTWGLPPNLDDLKAAIEDIKPAHMTVEYRLRYLTIAEVENMTLDEIEQTRQDKFSGGGA
ncbi:putative phage tail protein [Paenibacillus sp. FSL K6-2862]|uniref:putative phage tail protein n=1 Tax=Paenibacillus sp. FSL K6-2862 TaxID=2921484 RepID=UPI0030FB53C9